jgi:hypothetical protein
MFYTRDATTGIQRCHNQENWRPGTRRAEQRMERRLDAQTQAAGPSVRPGAFKNLLVRIARSFDVAVIVAGGLSQTSMRGDIAWPV